MLTLRPQPSEQVNMSGAQHKTGVGVLGALQCPSLSTYSLTRGVPGSTVQPSESQPGLC